MGILDNVQPKDRSGRVAFLEDGDHVLAFDTLENTSKGGDPEVIRATFRVEEDGLRHKKGEKVSIRFQVYGSSFPGHAKSERERLMELVMQTFGLTDAVQGSQVYEKMLDKSQPARGILVKSSGYLKPVKLNDDGSVPLDKNDKPKRPWPVIAFNNVAGQTKEAIAARRADMETETVAPEAPAIEAPAAVAAPVASGGLDLDSLLI